MKSQWMMISMFVFALITAIFAVINVESVQVNFLFAQTSLPLILVILTSTLLGGLIVGLFGVLRYYQLQRKVKQLEKQVKAMSPTSELSDPAVQALEQPAVLSTEPSSSEQEDPQDPEASKDPKDPQDSTS
ncbi:LapA family protein [Paenibacillus hexagrammi]|uniref:Lipopolysaccharide assembly protein LapA domain-containing protein n=1 Tax=Paenibacillus hexagrammi TaxID=2908839 RepID=A0ABY3SC93_9BACL|nr:lipopolysaccharide assembly protein LapA domain-containing protein [Paenibacillus sp. YPD9-1]UJF31627.1 lipopolysaccharide assembly protein LapA domain-containing protein [Paenibacillus sp. YPD9-1]